MPIDSGKMRDDHRVMLCSAWMFAGITANDIDNLCKEISIQAFPPGCTVLGAEDSCQMMYIVLKGKVKAVNVDKDGTETILAIHGKGESFGEIALLDSKSSPAVVITIEHSKLAIINKNQFYSMLSAHPEIASNVTHMLCAKLREAWANNAILAGNHQCVSEKVRKILLQLLQKHGTETKNGTLLDIKLTHQSLADMMGLTRPYLTRTLAELQKSGIISVVKTNKGNRILIQKA